MLKLTVPATELYDEVNNQFITLDETTLELEHSLVSLSRWESKWEKPFLSPDKKTSDETWGYIQDMCLDEEVSFDVLNRLDQSHIEKINSYIEDKMTATWFTELPGKPPSREIITAEIIYYWMIALNIPLECEEWHLNRLFTLIKVLNQKNQPEKKVSRNEAAAQRRALNEKRKAQMKTSG